LLSFEVFVLSFVAISWKSKLAKNKNSTLNSIQRIFTSKEVFQIERNLINIRQIWWEKISQQ
jgi:hypothetical protein